MQFHLPDLPRRTAEANALNWAGNCARLFGPGIKARVLRPGYSGPGTPVPSRPAAWRRRSLCFSARTVPGSAARPGRSPDDGAAAADVAVQALLRAGPVAARWPSGGSRKRECRPGRRSEVRGHGGQLADPVPQQPGWAGTGTHAGLVIDRAQQGQQPARRRRPSPETSLVSLHRGWGSSARTWMGLSDGKRRGRAPGHGGGEVRGAVFDAEAGLTRASQDRRAYPRQRGKLPEAACSHADGLGSAGPQRT